MEKGKILIVDDDPMVRDALSKILCEEGYKAEVAIDGFEGIEKVKNNEYDIIFTDLTMPRVSGIDFLRQARNINSAIPVVVITGFSTIDNAISAMREGANDFITKPFKVDTVTHIVERILGERRLLGKCGVGEDYETSIGRLNAELFKRLQEISILQSISTELDTLYDNREIYERIVEMILKLLMVREASFGIIENGNLKIEAVIGVAKKDIPIAGSIFENVIKSRNYYIALHGEINPHNETPLASPFFAVPFIMNGEVFGILSLSNKIDGTTFTDDEISLVLTFVKKAALRIENNALYDVFYNNLINTLKSLVLSIEARDPYTRRHSERVASFALQIADTMNLGEEAKDAIRFGGYLHDIGKIGVRDTVLLKPGKLTDEEMTEIRLHPVVGDNIIKPLRFFPMERELIRYHHECFNGSGYPDGLEGDKIPLFVRILSVADTYDAMTSSRPYRTARVHGVAIEEIKRCSNSQFDGEVVRAFLQTPVGKGEAHGT